MTETQEKIQSRIRQLKQKQQANALYVPAATTTSTKWKWKGFIPAYLGSCIFLLTIATIGLMANKNTKQQQIAQVVPSVRQPIFTLNTLDTSGVLTSDQSEDFLTTLDGEKMVVDVAGRLDNLESKVSTWEHRTWLLSLAVNENANIANRYHKDGYITFDKDWKLSGMPMTMDLSEETKMQLREADLSLEAATGVKTECKDHHYVMEPDDMHYHCTKCGARYARQRNGVFRRVSK